MVGVQQWPDAAHLVCRNAKMVCIGVHESQMVCIGVQKSGAVPLRAPHHFQKDEGRRMKDESDVEVLGPW
jgi:hypothetical protein